MKIIMLFGFLWSLCMAQAATGEVSVTSLSSPSASSIRVNPNEAVFEVHGIVCSFCSKGVEKKLSRLSFVDASKYHNGVLVEIESQRVTVRIKQGQSLDSVAAFKAIRSGGYEPIRVHIALKNGNTQVIEADNNG